MTRLLRFAAVILLALSLTACARVADPTPPAPQTGEKDEAAVRSLVEDFGSKLQLVSLSAPKEAVIGGLQEHYAGLVSPALLKAWQEDLKAAPGRHFSSPWRIGLRSPTLRSCPQASTR